MRMSGIQMTGERRLGPLPASSCLCLVICSSWASAVRAFDAEQAFFCLLQVQMNSRSVVNMPHVWGCSEVNRFQPAGLLNVALQFKEANSPAIGVEIKNPVDRVASCPVPRS